MNFTTVLPYNIVRLELARRGLSDDPYERAAETAQTWKDSGVLKHDEKAIYIRNGRRI
ncbi:MAG: hypothetical protein Ct9H300mP19_02950 [Dehalococcoidia bacterium]|nr:MAG: hypothetical protein Ct9H300mP19_02950 [Dehalococcoidia bacterium]